MTVRIVIIEGLAMCFDLVMVCIVLIANGVKGIPITIPRRLALQWNHTANLSNPLTPADL